MDRKIACNHCKNEISEYWEKHSMVVWFVLGLVAVGFVELLESAWFLDLSYLVAFWGFLMVLAYYLVPFKKP
jgi:hypothetical protein